MPFFSMTKNNIDFCKRKKRVWLKCFNQLSVCLHNCIIFTPESLSCVHWFNVVYWISYLAELYWAYTYFGFYYTKNISFKKIKNTFGRTSMTFSVFRKVFWITALWCIGRGKARPPNTASHWSHQHILSGLVNVRGGSCFQNPSVT